MTVGYSQQITRSRQPQRRTGVGRPAVDGRTSVMERASATKGLVTGHEHVLTLLAADVWCDFVCSPRKRKKLMELQAKDQMEKASSASRKTARRGSQMQGG